MIENKIFFVESASKIRKLVKPTRLIETPSKIFVKKVARSVQKPNTQISEHLGNIIKKQSRIYKKIATILSGKPPSVSQSSSSVPVKTSRISPFIYNNRRLQPLPVPISPLKVLKRRPMISKKLEKLESLKDFEEFKEFDFKALSISSKALNKRFSKPENSKKVDMGINTKEEMTVELEEIDDDELESYFVYKSCLS
jgi:hypothetical protein